MADFKTPNLCGANPELNTALSKIDDLKNEIASKVDSLASEAAAAFETGLADVKSGLDGLAIDLPEIPPINFQSELTGLINDIDKTTIQGIAAFNAKLATLELDFGNTLKEKGLTLDSLITESTTKLSGGGNICDLVPNIDIPAGNSGTGVTTEEIEERVSNAATLTLTQTPKEILEVQGKKTTQQFFTNIQYTQNGKVIVPKATGTYQTIKVKYTVSLVKEKPVEAKQAATPPEAEEFSSITKNASAETKKTELKAKVEAVKSGEVFVKADPVKDVEPVVVEGGKTIQVTTPNKSVTVVSSSTKTTTTTGGGVIEADPIFAQRTEKRRKTQSNKGLSRKVLTLTQKFVLKGSINEEYHDLRRHKVIEDMSSIKLFRPCIKIKLRIEAAAEQSVITPGVKPGSVKGASYKETLKYSPTKAKYGKNNITPTFEGKQLTLTEGPTIKAEQGKLVNVTKVKVKYQFFSTVDPDYSG